MNKIENNKLKASKKLTSPQKILKKFSPQHISRPWGPKILHKAQQTMSGDITKQDLYEGVKTLIETDALHIHLTQQKLFTLFSVGFQYLLFESTRNPGAYIIRVEDGYLADKLAKKSKDPSTR